MDMSSAFIRAGEKPLQSAKWNAAVDRSSSARSSQSRSPSGCLRAEEDKENCGGQVCVTSKGKKAATFAQVCRSRETVSLSPITPPASPIGTALQVRSPPQVSVPLPAAPRWPSQPSKPDALAATLKQKPDKKARRMCKQFQQKGTCSFGARCLYHHSLPETCTRVSASSVARVSVSPPSPSPSPPSLCDELLRCTLDEGEERLDKASGKRSTKESENTFVQVELANADSGAALPQQRRATPAMTAEGTWSTQQPTPLFFAPTFGSPPLGLPSLGLPPLAPPILPYALPFPFSQSLTVESQPTQSVAMMPNVNLGCPTPFVWEPQAELGQQQIDAWPLQQQSINTASLAPGPLQEKSSTPFTESPVLPASKGVLNSGINAQQEWQFGKPAFGSFD